MDPIEIYEEVVLEQPVGLLQQVEQGSTKNDEWLVGRRYLSAAAMEPLLENRLHRVPTPDREEVRKLTPA